MRRWPVYGTVMLITVASGLTIRFAALGLPWFAMKYGGSMLWALMIYWVLALLLPGRRVWWLAGMSGLLATSLELTRLWRYAPLDAFRETLAGVILLGRYFSLWNILAYWIAVAAGGLMDEFVIRRWIGQGDASTDSPA